MDSKLWLNSHDIQNIRIIVAFLPQVIIISVSAPEFSGRAKKRQQNASAEDERYENMKARHGFIRGKKQLKHKTSFCSIPATKVS